MTMLNGTWQGEYLNLWYKCGLHTIHRVQPEAGESWSLTLLLYRNSGRFVLLHRAYLLHLGLDYWRGPTQVHAGRMPVCL